MIEGEDAPCCMEETHFGGCNILGNVNQKTGKRRKLHHIRNREVEDRKQRQDLVLMEGWKLTVTHHRRFD